MIKVKKVILCMLFMFGCLFLNGCGETTIDGEWVLVKKIHYDGTVLDKSDIEESGTMETYIINGSEVYYKCVTPYGTTDFEMTMVETDENEYTFYISDRLVFAVATLDGKELSYEVGLPGETSTFIFKKK